MPDDVLVGAAERQWLLQLARRAIDARVRRHPPPPLDGDGPDLRCGAFVTIHCAGELRGCLGRLDCDTSLGLTVRELAASVTDSDPRFAALEVHELTRITIEISVLSPEREVSDVAEIEVGRHGLIVQQGLRRGLLLPQVAADRGWDRDTFLEHACLKAGLPADAWRRGARVFVFEAEVFGDSISS